MKNDCGLKCLIGLLFVLTIAVLPQTTFSVPTISSVDVDPDTLEPGTAFTVTVDASDVTRGLVLVDFRPTVPSVLRLPLTFDGANNVWTATGTVPAISFPPGVDSFDISVRTLVFNASRQRAQHVETMALQKELELAPPQVILSQTMTASSDVTASGAAPGASTVQILGGANFIQSNVTNGTFSAVVSLNPNKVNHLFFTGVATDGTPSAPTPATVVQDSQSPSLFIDFPPDGADLTNETIDVAGRVRDLLSGFMGLEVTVNGANANVIVGIGTNGTFERTGVPLTVGANTISATATDELGNSVSKQVTVNRVVIPDDAHKIVALSGNSQTGEIITVLPDPVVIKVERNDGTPFVNKLVMFKVTRSNGRLTTDGIGDGELELQARTDNSGLAQAFWKLGSDAGCGNNRMEVTSSDIVGTTFFCASADPASPKQINIGSGNNQRAEAGGPAPEPLRVWVNDSCNGVEGVPVTFAPILGGGKVNGEDSVTVNTGITGHAAVDFTLGPEKGNNLVEADFPGNPGNPAVFVVFGVVRDETQPTRFSLLVLTNSGNPIRWGGVSPRYRDGSPDYCTDRFRRDMHL